MKYLFYFLIAIIFSFQTEAQILPFIDYNNYLKVFYKGQPRQLEYQPIKSFAFGDNILAYIDSKDDLRYYDGTNVVTATNMIVDYKVSDTYLAFRISNALYYIENGKPKNLTMFAGDFIVKDSLILYEDQQYNSWNVVYKGRKTPLYQAIGSLKTPGYVGDNIIVYQDHGDVYRVFHKGRSYEFGVWMDKIDFSAGTNILCFNDPSMGTFAVFEDGEFMDVEPQYVKSYKSGKDFIVYEDINGNLKYYSNGKVHDLSNFPRMYEVADEVVFFQENNYMYTFYKGKKTLVCNYVPKDFKLKNKTIAFRNNMGGVSVFLDGKVTELTIQQDAQYEISGNYVLVQLFNRSYLVVADGKTYSM